MTDQVYGQSSSDQSEADDSSSASSRPSSAASFSTSITSLSPSPSVASLDGTPVFSRAYNALDRALTFHEPSSAPVQEALHFLSLSNPFLPPAQLIYGE